MYAADGDARPNSGGAPFRQSVLHILPRAAGAPYSNSRRSREPLMGRRPRRNVSARNVSRAASPPETHFTRAPLQATRTTRVAHPVQPPWMNSRNLTNIASESKHRQPIVLHPSFCGPGRNRKSKRGRSPKRTGGDIGVRGRVNRRWATRQLAESAVSLYTTCFPIE
jgi:hypothetical protein